MENTIEEGVACICQDNRILRFDFLGLGHGTSADKAFYQLTETVPMDHPAVLEGAGACPLVMIENIRTLCKKSNEFRVILNHFPSFYP
jgi:hypothetical protein